MGMAQIAIADGTKIEVGRGSVFFDRFNSSGAKQGSNFLGNVSKLEIAASVELSDKRTSVDATNAILATIEKARTLTANLEFSEYSKENVALALFGLVSEYTQTNTPIVGETLTSSTTKGRTYFTAKRKVTAYTVKASAVTKTEGTDYEIDTETGAVFIKPSGTIADASTLTIDYTPTTISSGTGLRKVQIGAAPSILGELRFVGNPLNGEIHELILWRCLCTPTGALQYIAEDFVDTPLQFRLIADFVGHSTEPYGVHYIR